MVTTSFVVGIVLTIIVLLLTILTINKGYGFKHTIDSTDKDAPPKEYTDNGEHRKKN